MWDLNIGLIDLRTYANLSSPPGCPHPFTYPPIKSKATKNPSTEPWMERRHVELIIPGWCGPHPWQTCDKQVLSTWSRQIFQGSLRLNLWNHVINGRSIANYSDSVLYTYIYIHILYYSLLLYTASSSCEQLPLRLTIFSCFAMIPHLSTTHCGRIWPQQ